VHPEHRQAIFDKICDSFEDIRAHLVIRVALWILGEYASSQKDVDKAFETIKRNIGTLPIFALEQGQPGEGKEEKKDGASAGPKIITKTIILPDGSYGTETIVVDDSTKAKAAGGAEDNFPLRRALINTEDDYVSSCLAITLTKLAIKSKKNLSTRYNQLAVDSILIICALLKGHAKKRYDPDSKKRMQLCLRVLSNPLGLQSLTSVE
jgi:coatomer subunit beta